MFMYVYGYEAHPHILDQESKLDVLNKQAEMKMANTTSFK